MDVNAHMLTLNTHGIEGENLNEVEVSMDLHGTGLRYHGILRDGILRDGRKTTGLHGTGLKYMEYDGLRFTGPTTQRNYAGRDVDITVLGESGLEFGSAQAMNRWRPCFTIYGRRVTPESTLNYY